MIFIYFYKRKGDSLRIIGGPEIFNTIFENARDCKILFEINYLENWERRSLLFMYLLISIR